MKYLAILSAAALAACSPQADTADGRGNAVQENIADAPVPGGDTLENAAAPAPTPSAAATSTSPRTLALEGLGDLRIGQAVPAGSSWRERGAQTGDSCRTVSSPDFPGAYAIVTDGKVQRITIGQRSDVKLVEGVGIGSSEADVKKWFAGFREEPHKYVEAPGKYLTAPNAASGDPALRFEIGADRKVSMMHVGTMPVLGYVEGCS